MDPGASGGRAIEGSSAATGTSVGVEGTLVGTSSSGAGVAGSTSSATGYGVTAVNSAANQSSNSGWLGRSPCAPKSDGVATMPRPKW